MRQRAVRTTPPPPGEYCLGRATYKRPIEVLRDENNTHTMVGLGTVYPFQLETAQCWSSGHLNIPQGGKQNFPSPYSRVLKSWPRELTECLESLAWKCFSNLVHSKVGFQSAYLRLSVKELLQPHCFPSIIAFLYIDFSSLNLHTHHEKSAVQ